MTLWTNLQAPELRVEGEACNPCTVSPLNFKFLSVIEEDYIFVASPLGVGEQSCWVPGSRTLMEPTIVIRLM